MLKQTLFWVATIAAAFFIIQLIAAPSPALRGNMSAIEKECIRQATGFDKGYTNCMSDFRSMGYIQ